MRIHNDVLTKVFSHKVCHFENMPFNLLTKVFFYHIIMVKEKSMLIEGFILDFYHLEVNLANISKCNLQASSRY